MSDVNNLIQPMYNGSLFEVSGREHTANRKVVNPFFAHPQILPSTIKAFEDFSDRWGEEYSGDVLEVRDVTPRCWVHRRAALILSS